MLISELKTLDKVYHNYIKLKANKQTNKQIIKFIVYFSLWIHNYLLLYQMFWVLQNGLIVALTFSSTCCLKWNHWSQKFMQYKFVKVPWGFLKRWSPACQYVTVPFGSRRRPAVCSTLPFSSATSCRQV